MKYIAMIIAAGFLIFTACSALKPAVGDHPDNKQEITGREKEPAKKEQVKVEYPVEKKEVIPEKTSAAPRPITDMKKESASDELKDEPDITEDQVSFVAPDKAAYTVSGLEISEKTNGILMLLNFKGDNPKNNITTFFSGDNFFNITFYKGKFSPSVKKYIYNKAHVTKIKFIEYKESVQITVRFREDFKSSSVVVEGNSVMISVYDKNE
ncbi:MAG TPA: hypothetical protein PLK90_00345 [Clostridiales bacterium]|nr:hypothetical protein [Clostridiales bacterium]HQP68827.1 hypothetical protein [Clostridiales bacterium]